MVKVFDRCGCLPSGPGLSRVLCRRDSIGIEKGKKMKKRKIKQDYVLRKEARISITTTAKRIARVLERVDFEKRKYHVFEYFIFLGSKIGSELKLRGVKL